MVWMAIAFGLTGAGAVLALRADKRSQKRRMIYFTSFAVASFLVAVGLMFVGLAQEEHREEAADRAKNKAVASVVEAVKVSGFTLAFDEHGKEWKAIKLDAMRQEASVRVYVPGYGYSRRSHGTIVAKLVDGRWQLGCIAYGAFASLAEHLELTMLLAVGGTCPAGWTPEAEVSPGPRV
jgi:hypothetical protein